MYARWLVFVGMLLVPTTQLWGNEPDPWAGPAFSAKPAAILHAAKTAADPKEADVEMLFEEHHFQLDAQGREHRAVHRVFRYLTERGVEDWSYTEADWSPWCEEKPVIRARVITADGQTHPLDPESVAEVPAGPDDPSLFSDQKLLRAPLPAIEVGAVVEEEIINREARPLFDRGLVERLLLSDTHPVRELRIIIEAPAALPLHYEVLGSTLQPVRSAHDGRVTWLFQAGPLPAQDPPEPYMPPDVCRWPQLVFATGKSWAEVAARYNELVEPQLDGKAVASLVHETLGKETDRDKIIARLLKLTRTQVRYTGIEFGKGAIVPRTPGETLTRRYGDCKDQSALLVAMLRVAGVPARLALLRSGRFADVVPALPGLGDFDHCIVYLPGARPSWIDPSARCVPAGQLPLVDQGRWAMVADPQTHELIRTPRMDYRQNTSREIHEIFLSPEKKARVRVTVSGTGSCDDDLREDYAGQNAKELRKAWREFFKGKYHAQALGRLEYARPLDLSQPFHVVAEVSDARPAKFGDQEIALSLRPDPLFERLPGLFKGLDSDAEEDDGPRVSQPEQGDRKTPLVLPEPHVREVQFRVAPPPGFAAATLPPDFDKHFGPATLSQHFERGEGNLIVATFRIDTGPGEFTAGEVNALRQAIAELGGNDGADPWEIKIPLIPRAASESRSKRT